MTLPELKQLPTQEEVDALKAQVNCLRDELRATHDFLWKAGIADYIARDIEKALEVTPEQCLAEVKAKAIEDAANSCCFQTLNGKQCYAESLQELAKNIREQAK